MFFNICLSPYIKVFIIYENISNKFSQPQKDGIFIPYITKQHENYGSINILNWEIFQEKPHFTINFLHNLKLKKC